jgi:outer membrane protein OmpA-like peptidoglycan-associated protein
MNISDQWYEGDLECSFHTMPFLEGQIDEFNVNHIIPHGRKIICNARTYSGDPNCFLETCSYLDVRVLSGVEIFPLNSTNYPLDIPRKFNAIEVVIITPQISNVRIDAFKNQGTLNAKAYFKLEKLNTTKVFDKDEVLYMVETTDNLGSNIEHDYERRGCFRLLPSWILRPFRRSRSELSANQRIMAGGCLTPGLNGGCANPGIGGGCLNTLRFGCGGLISLLLLIGLINMFLRGCNSEAVVETDDQKTEIETGEKKVDLTPWEIEDKDSSKQPNKDTLAQTKIKTIIVPNVQFYTNSAQLLPSSKEDLNTIALYMLENPTIKGVITGHTDSLGDEDKNQTLSLQRAESVMYYLMEYGIDQNQLSAKGKGEGEPIASNEKMEGRLMNRRVEITFYN